MDGARTPSDLVQTSTWTVRQPKVSFLIVVKLFGKIGRCLKAFEEKLFKICKIGGIRQVMRRN